MINLNRYYYHFYDTMYIHIQNNINTKNNDKHRIKYVLDMIDQKTFKKIIINNYKELNKDRKIFQIYDVLNVFF